METAAEYAKALAYKDDLGDEFNARTRAKIRKFKNAHNGVCYLGYITLHDWNRDKPILRKYTHGMVFTLDAAFAIPDYDEKLVKMIRDRDEGEYTTTPHDCVLVDQIINRIVELGGICLNWN